MNGKDISLVVGRAVASSEARQIPMRTQKYQATTRSARWDHFFSKWVRAKVSISSRVQKRAFTYSGCRFCCVSLRVNLLGAGLRGNRKPCEVDYERSDII
jgi:hypothetical protein